MCISPKVEKPVVLDFFAGSGTQGQAVLEEFKGENAEFILCNSNENNIYKEIICMNYDNTRLPEKLKKYRESNR